MFKKVGFSLVCLGICMSASAFAAASVDTPFDPSLKQATSCSEVETVMKDYLNTYRNAGNFGPVKAGGMIMNDTATKAAVNVSDGVGGGGGGDPFSATNVQKAGIDEPEIVKNDGTYIYYLDQQLGVIHILDAGSQKEVNKILLSKEYWNAQLLLNGKKLVIVGSKNINTNDYARSFVLHDQQTVVAIYDVSNVSALKLVQSYLYDGYLQDSRLVGSKLVFVSSQSLNRGPVYTAVQDMVGKNTTTSLTPANFTIKATDILPKWTTVSYKSVTTAGKIRVIANKKSLPISCSQLLYKKATAQKGMRYVGGDALTSIVTLPLDQAIPTPTIKTVIGDNTSVHISAKSIYLTAPTYIPYAFACPMAANIMCQPWRGEGSYTTIYGFNLNDVTYKYASLVQGTTYNQYSMDEDAKGVFRMVTSDRSNGKNATNVYTIGANGKVLGKLENLAPNENFYGVRFLGEDLYLVTYKQMDPLFVISLADASKPRVIGELKMPGYSTYLHPYGAKENGVQYLIGLGYDTKTNANGGEQQGGIKLDLYKVDFNKADANGKIAVSQAWSKIFGEAGSQTEALYNPRMFIYNTAKKELLLPMVLTQTIKGQQCNVIYDTEGKEISKQCYPTDQATTTFAGLKAWTLSSTSLTDMFSINYANMITNPYDDSSQSIFTNPRLFQGLNARVGYNGGNYYFVGNQFAHFFTADNQSGAYVQFGTGR